MKEWLSGIVGESAANIVGFALIFAIILGGIFVVVSIIRRFSGGTFSSNGRGRQPRLSVMDAAAVDSRRKLVLIRRDDVEHLLLIGGPTDVVVEQNIVMESRAHARQASRIEPEHIERFRQHEALTAEKGERTALPASAEKDDAIQLTSAIEAPAYRKPEPAATEPAPQPAAPERREEPRDIRAPQAVQTPRAPVPPVTPQPPASRPAAPVAQPVRPQPQPRPAASEPAQPRPAVAPRPQQTARLHPTYPLSQVSKGVLASTSNVSAAASTVAAAASLGSIVPEREPASAPRPAPAALDVTGPGVSSTPAPEFSRPAEEKRVEPEASFAPATPQPAAVPEPDDSLEDLGGALHDAIMADLDADAASAEKEAPAEPEVDLFEDELLSSLDISAADEEKPAEKSDNIEDEMEKLLGDLTRDETRRI